MQSSSSLMSGVPELLLLQLLAEREMYGYELARAIRTTTHEAISVGESVLYPALHTLERRGLLRARRRTVNGRARVYYTLTPGGQRRLKKMTQEWRRIAGGVEAALLGGQDV
jgi:PadR family transcriptional regulator, regulatory protein PadR